MKVIAVEKLQKIVYDQCYTGVYKRIMAKVDNHSIPYGWQLLTEENMPKDGTECIIKICGTSLTELVSAWGDHFTGNGNIYHVYDVESILILPEE